MKRGFTVLAGVTALLLSIGLYAALVGAPTEKSMGDVQRIFYYHVSSAWTAFLLFLVNFVASIIYLVKRKDSSDILALVSAEVGVVFCTVVIVTGPIWARPVWGIWWAPDDIRLKSTLVMWLVYISYLILRKLSTSSMTALIAAVVSVFAALLVPFVFFSIWLYRTQHPSPVIARGGSLDPKMWMVLLINWAAFLALAWLVCRTRYRLEVAQRAVHEAEAMQSLMEGAR
jgi:heme exporter protein C